MVGIAIDEGRDAAKRVKRFASAQKIAYPVALDAGKEPMHEAFKVKTVPATFLLDQEGRVVAQWTGSPASMREVEEKLGALLRKAD